jgi:Flp pilus assembly protein TadD
MTRVSAYIIVVLVLAGTTSCLRSPQYFVEKGNQLMAQGKYDDAILQYRKAIQKDANFGEAHFSLGKALLRQHNGVDAYYAFLHANQLLPQRDDIKIQLGDVAVSYLIQLDNHPKLFYDQTVSLRDSFLARDPNSFDGLRWKGYLEVVDRKLPEAAESFKKALQKKPDDALVNANLVDVLLKMGRTSEAEKIGSDQLVKHPGNLELYDVLYRYYRLAQRNSDAEALLKAKISNFPKEPDYVFQLASHYATVGNAAEMNRVVANYAQDRREHPLAPLQVGDFCSRVGLFADALRWYEEGAKSDPKNAQTYQKRIANSLLEEGRTEEARRIVEQLYKSNTKDVAVRGVRASLMVRTGNPDDLAHAIDEFQTLLKEEPQNATLRVGLGEALLAKGDLSSARKELQAAVTAQPQLVAPRYALADIAIAQHNAADLVQQADSLIRLQPFGVRAHRYYARALAESGNTDQARLEFNQLLARNPADTETRAQLALLEIRVGRFKEADNLLKAAPGAGRPESSGLSTLQARTLLHIWKNEPKQALALLQDAVQKQPKDAQIRALLAKIAAKLGDIDTAIAQYKFLAAQMKSSEFYYELGKLQDQKGDGAGARLSYLEMQRLAPRDARAEFSLGRAAERNGKATEAIEHYQTAVHLGSNDPVVFNNLAYLLADSGKDLDRAMDLARKALASAPLEPGIEDTMGYVYLKKNMNDSAVTVFSKLVRKYPKEPAYRFHLGMALVQKGDKTGARRELQACLLQPQPQEQVAKINALLTTIR